MKDSPPTPSRLQKRWSGRLRTLGALLMLLGTVGLADYVLSGFGAWMWGAIAVGLGAVCFVVGKRWSESGAG